MKLLLIVAAALAAEGKWTPQQFSNLGDARLRKEGLKLPLKKLWDESKGTGLLAGAINIDGCSAGFISPDGLFVTNHHCLFPILQQHSTPDKNLIDNGYLAKSRTEELRSDVSRARIPYKFTDVSAQLQAAIPAEASDLIRYRAIERKSKELIAQCEKNPSRRCDVSSFNGGSYFMLIETIEIRDVRLVWAPPRSVGEFGGETDNWQWPRHTGDFAIARAYVGPNGEPAFYAENNIPYKSEHHFPLAKKGVSPGDFVMVLGYPGRSYRTLSAAEVAEREDVFFTQRGALLKEWIELSESVTAKIPAGKIALAADVKSMENRRKNAEGQLEGLKRWQVLETRTEFENSMMRFNADSDGAKALRELKNEVEKMRLTSTRDLLLSMLQVGSGQTGSRALASAITVARLSRERAKPDLERDPELAERNWKRITQQSERDQKRMFAPADIALSTSVISKLLELPTNQDVPSVRALLGKFRGPELEKEISRRLSQSKIAQWEERSKMLLEDEETLKRRKDPWLEIAFAFANELENLRDRQDRYAGAIFRLRPQWLAWIAKNEKRPQAPDANSSLRVTYGHVKGYSPRDGVFYQPQTTLDGLLAKAEKGNEYTMSPRVLDAAKLPVKPEWKDPTLNDLPIAFLSDCDTTGGNSGSPTVNGNGELVGVNFDRVWENVANDFIYVPQVARNVNADSRYLLWLLDQVEEATWLLNELKVKR